MPSFDARSTDSRLLYDVTPFQYSTAYSNIKPSNGQHPSFLADIKHEASKIAQRLGLDWNLVYSMRNFNPRRLLSITTALTLVWIWVLYRGERIIFDKSISDCDWDTWEQWPAAANPHHLIFVADPQLVDPHTYPGRPWPLSTFTVKYTDLYLKRVFIRMQQQLYPDTIFFLGDLFDGGREWSTTLSKSPEKQYHKYGDDFWFREYKRFGNIFFKSWIDSGSVPRPGQPGRRIITTLPGNHDLGFAAGIQKPVRKRFNTYFGDGNRVDIVANHTFVSIDAVSLSAWGAEAGTDEELYKPTLEFLEGVQDEKKRAMIRELRVQTGLSARLPYKHAEVETASLANDRLPSYNATEYENDFPTILLSHVPLYRAPGTPCGPLREHWPPSPPPKGQTDPVFPDPRNAIAVQAGYQYQNVLTPDVSRIVTEKIGQVQYAFSGDDHDYCELVHMGYSGAGSGIREITVKSISWAMGVRKPGFVMLSLWNEVDEWGKRKPLPGSTSKMETLQTHLCLLPDEIGTLIRYGTLAGFSLVVLLIRAAVLTALPSRSSYGREQQYESILPTSSAQAEKASDFYDQNHAHSAMASNSSTASHHSQLSVRSTTARAKSVSPAPGGYGIPASNGGYGLQPQQEKYSVPLVSHAGYFGPLEDNNAKDAFISTNVRTGKPLRGLSLFWAEFTWGLKIVGIPAFGWYFWLVWTG